MLQLLRSNRATPFFAYPSGCGLLAADEEVMASSAEPLFGLRTWNPLLGHVTMVWELRNWMCRIRFGPRQNQTGVHEFAQGGMGNDNLY